MKDSRAAWRIAIVCVLTALFIAVSVPDIGLPWHPFSSFGFDADPSGKVTDVRSGSAAAASRLAPGDRIDLAAASFAVRRVLLTPYSAAPAGQTAIFPVIDSHGRRYDLSLVAQPVERSTVDNFADVVQCLSYPIFLFIAAALVLMRPSGLTWAFYGYALCATGASLTVLMWTPFVLSILVMCVSAMQTLAWLPFAAFALRFPTDRVDGWRLGAQRLLLGLSVVLVPLAVYAVLGELYCGPFVKWVAPLIYQYLPVVGFFIGAAIFIGTYVHANQVDRPRIRWVILGFFLGTGGLTIAIAYVQTGFGNVPIWLNDLLQATDILVPITVAYAVVKHRVIDIQFYLNRALVYGLLTTIALGIVAVLHWFVSRQLEEFHLGIIFELGGAMAIGFSILKFHGWVETLVDRYVFRSVHHAETHLAKIGESMMYAGSMDGLDQLVCLEPRRALDLGWAAVFHAGESGSYRRAALAGVEAVHTEFDRDDAVVLQLRASKLPLSTPDAVAFPLVVRDEMLGFVLFGAHANGSAIDPNEREILESFVRRAAIAYDHLTSKLRAGENARLRVENETLRSLILPQN